MSTTYSKNGPIHLAGKHCFSLGKLYVCIGKKGHCYQTTGGVQTIPNILNDTFGEVKSG